MLSLFVALFLSTISILFNYWSYRFKVLANFLSDLWNHWTNFSVWRTTFMHSTFCPIPWFTHKNYSLIMWRLLFDPKIRKPGSNSGLLKKKIEFLYEKHWNFEYLWLHILVSVWTFTSCGGIHQLRLHISYLFMIYWKYHISLWLLCILSQYFFRWVLIRQSRNYFQLFFSEFLDFPGVPSFV